MAQIEELTGDADSAKQIYDASRIVNKYCFYFNSIDIGINYSPKDLKFSEMLLFSWIKDGLSHGRKN